MNLNIKWVNCATRKYQRAETFTVGNWRADVREEPIVDLCVKAVWSITNLETGEIQYGGTKRATHIVSMMANGKYDAYKLCKEECERYMHKLIDKLLTKVVEEEVLNDDA